MKSLFYFVAFAAVSFCAGCLDSNEGFLHFDFIVNYDTPESTIPGNPILSLLPPQSLPEIPVDMNTDSEFNSQIFDHLVDIELRQLVFTITASSTDPAVDLLEPATPTPDDWSFLESVEIWFRNPTTLEEGLAAYIAAGDTQLDPGNSNLSFACTEIDLLDYFDGGNNTVLVIKAVGTTPPDDVIFQVSARFRVVAALIK